jgi:hypothetical protein
LSVTDEPISFEQQIKPLFRDRDRQSMTWAFDLWSRDDVAANGEAILGKSATARCPAMVLGRTSRSPSFNAGSRRDPPPSLRAVAAPLLTWPDTKRPVSHRDLVEAVAEGRVDAVEGV